MNFYTLDVQHVFGHGFSHEANTRGESIALGSFE